MSLADIQAMKALKLTKQNSLSIKKAQKLYSNKNLLRESLLEGFASITNWSITNCSVSMDTVNYKIGGGALSILQTTPDTYTQFSKNISLDLSDASTIEITFYIPDVTKINQFSLYFYNAGTNVYSYFIINASSHNLFNGWNTCRIAPSEFTSNNGGSLSTPVTAITISISGATGQQATLVVDSLKKNVKTDLMVAFVFDDGFASAYNVVKPMFDSRNVKANFAVNKYTIGTTNYITLSQMQEMYAKGHDVLNHSLTHPHLETKTYTQVVNEIQDMQSYLINNGITRGSDIFIYPTSWTQIAQNVCTDLGYTVCRDIVGVANYNNINNYRLRTVSTNNVTTLASLSPYVDKMINRGGLLIYTVHDVVTTPDVNNSLQTATQTLSDLVDYVISKNIKIVRLSDWCDGQFN